MLDVFNDYLFYENNPLLFPFENLKWSLKNNNNNNFLFITYESLVKNTDIVIKKIYDFCEMDFYNHNFTKVKNNLPEGDYEIKGLHEVRDVIEKRNKKVKLKKEHIQIANKMQKELDAILKEVNLNVF